MEERNGRLYAADDCGDCSILIPSKREVCGRCEGRGVHDHEAFSNGICASDFDSPVDRDDFMEDYGRGVFDVRCSECKGRNVVLVPDWERLDEEQRRAVEEWQEYEAEVAAERRMRARGIQF